LKALRELALELYSYNTMTLEAAEMRSRLADLKQQGAHANGASTLDRAVDAADDMAESSVQSPSDSKARGGDGQEASVPRAGPVEGAAEQVQPIAGSTEAPDRAGGEAAGASDEVAELASDIWDDAADAEAAEAEADAAEALASTGHTAQHESRLTGSPVRGELMENGSDAEPEDIGGEEAAVELLAGGVNLPHPGKAATGGEDAFFVSAAHGGGVGVADGVSSWALEGVDAALYSRWPHLLLSVKACRASPPLPALKQTPSGLRLHVPGN
jgi:protein phosphatase PTC7